MIENLHTALFEAWDREIERSRPHWLDDPISGFAYNRNAPSIAYDPGSIPYASLGSFTHLKYRPPAEANHLAVTRETIESGHDKGSLLHEFGNELIAHPDREDLIVIPNRWPRVSYHSLIVTKALDPQNLTASLAYAELYWAKIGFVVEFHRFDRILNHFHFHVYPGGIAPIYRTRDSFHARATFDMFETGTLADYPAPHIAIKSYDHDWIAGAMETISSHIDALKVPYGQITMAASDGAIVLLIFLRATFRIEGVSFSLIGLIRTDQEFSLDAALQFVKDIHWTHAEMDKLESTLVALLA